LNGLSRSFVAEKCILEVSKMEKKSGFESVKENAARLLEPIPIPKPLTLLDDHTVATVHEFINESRT
jgi:hypothetical protein